jgi:hypothetical protein
MGETVAEMQGMVVGMKAEMASMKEKMSDMKAKFEELAKAPASGKTMAAAGKVKMEAFSTATNDTAIKVARELMKNKNK